MLTWTTEQRKLGELVEWEKNPRQLSKHDAQQIAQSIKTFNLADPLVINADNQIIGGHQRKRVMLDNGYSSDDLVDVRVPSRQLTAKEVEELNLRLNRNVGGWDYDILANEFELTELLEWGFTEFELGLVVPEDYSDFDEMLESLEGYEEIDIKITVPAMHEEAVIDWLSNGESKTSPGMGKGVLRRCGLL